MHNNSHKSHICNSVKVHTKCSPAKYLKRYLPGMVCWLCCGELGKELHCSFQTANDH